MREPPPTHRGSGQELIKRADVLKAELAIVPRLLHGAHKQDRDLLFSL
jgi:hypothetical protein